MSPLARRRLLLSLPLGGAALAGGGFFAMLGRMGSGRFDPHDIHTPAAGRTVPDFALPAQAPGQGFDAALLRAQAQPVLVNFFASWCIPCVLEAQALAGLKPLLPIWGIAYKDKPDDAAGFVARSAAPYARIASDRAGLTAIDWGVSGVPESFLIAPGGRIAWHLAGPLDAQAIDTGLRPALTRLA